MTKGFSQISNYFIDEIVPTLSPAEAITMLVIIRQTNGYHKHKDYLSNSQLARKTGISTRSIIKIKKILRDKNLIDFENTYNTVITNNLEKVTSEKISLPSEKISLPSEKISLPSEKISHTKETIKETILNTSSKEEKKLDDASKKIKDEIIKIGVTENKAKEIILKHDPIYLKKHLESLKFRNAKNKASYFMASIENNYQIPEEILKLEEEKEKEDKEKILKPIFQTLNIPESTKNFSYKFEAIINRIQEKPLLVQKLSNSTINMITSELETNDKLDFIFFYNITKKKEFIKFLKENNIICSGKI